MGHVDVVLISCFLFLCSTLNSTHLNRFNGSFACKQLTRNPLEVLINRGRTHKFEHFMGSEVKKRVGNENAADKTSNFNVGLTKHLVQVILVKMFCGLSVAAFIAGFIIWLTFHLIFSFWYELLESRLSLA
ncbi:CLUMA_CG013888, isoform A [Clunio marinus]|uniref:CLUMA_CG013888, isoform A n=1 Tax=Clunio marinus TaxID=568069 RepID=A0A1J1IM38_9DIPT|nr:CLUMA_CG013888, isoform A [Clunio marinus]